MFFSAVSLMLAKIKNNNISIICTNCCDHPLRSREDVENDRFGQFTSHLPGVFRYTTGDKVKNILKELLDELDSRECGSSPIRTSIWWLVVQPELVQGLSEDGLFIGELKELLQKGPKYNIHVVMWNADAKQAHTGLQLTQTFFKDRVCLEMTSEEAKMVVGRELVPMPEGYKASHIGNYLTRFRIYDLPTGAWMNDLFEQVNKIFSTR